jgi:hypothetical protein
MLKIHFLFAGLIVAMCFGACVTTKKIDASLKGAKFSIDNYYSGPSSRVPDITLPGNINIDVDEVTGPSGMPPGSFSKRTAILVLPLIFYYRFQTNHLVTIGSGGFDQPLAYSFRYRLEGLLELQKDTILRESSEHYSLSIDLQSCSIQGSYAHGTWYSLNVSGLIDYVKPSSEVRIRWVLSGPNEAVAAGTIQVLLKSATRRKIMVTIISNGQRRQITENDGMIAPVEVLYADEYNVLSGGHLYRIVGTFSAGLNIAAEELVRELNKYFTAKSKN